jgi:hypothetical protein
MNEALGVHRMFTASRFQADGFTFTALSGTRSLRKDDIHMGVLFVPDPVGSVPLLPAYVTCEMLHEMFAGASAVQDRRRQ